MNSVDQVRVNARFNSFIPKRSTGVLAKNRPTGGVTLHNIERVKFLSLIKIIRTYSTVLKIGLAEKQPIYFLCTLLGFCRDENLCEVLY